MANRTKYNEVIHIKIVSHLRAMGFSRKMICEALGIDNVTLSVWFSKHLPFKEAYENGRQNLTEQCVNALAKRAIGYDIMEKVYEPIPPDPVIGKKKAGRPKNIKYKLVMKKSKHLAPDINAIKYFLNNRDAKNWRESQHIELNGRMEYSIIPADLTPDEDKHD